MRADAWALVSLRQALGLPGDPHDERRPMHMAARRAADAALGGGRRAAAPVAAALTDRILPAVLGWAATLEKREPAPEDVRSELRRAARHMLDRRGPGAQPLRPAVTCALLALHGAAAPPAPFLDLGHGDGAAAEVLDRGTPPACAVDLRVDGLLRARESGAATTHAAADARSLPLADGAVAGVRAVNVVHHLEDRTGTFAEVLRVLQPGGLFLFNAHIGHESGGSPVTDLLARLGLNSAAATLDEERRRTQGDAPPIPGPDQLGAELREAGFARVDTVPLVAPALNDVLETISHAAMLLGSRRDLAQPPVREPDALLHLLEDHVAALVHADAAACAADGGTAVLVRAWAPGEPPATPPPDPPVPVCPACRGDLQSAANALRCASCGADWPVLQGLPLTAEVFRGAEAADLLAGG